MVLGRHVHYMFPLYACADHLNMLPRTRSLPSHEGMYVIVYTIHFIRVLLRAVLTEHWFMWCESMRGAARAPLATSHCNYRLQLAACQISLLIMLQCWEAFALLQLSVLRLPELNASARACQRHSKTLKPVLVRWCAGIIIVYMSSLLLLALNTSFGNVQAIRA